MFGFSRSGPAQPDGATSVLDAAQALLPTPPQAGTEVTNQRDARAIRRLLDEWITEANSVRHDLDHAPTRGKAARRMASQSEHRARALQQRAEGLYGLSLMLGQPQAHGRAERWQDAATRQEKLLTEDLQLLTGWATTLGSDDRSTLETALTQASEDLHRLKDYLSQGPSSPLDFPAAGPTTL